MMRHALVSLSLLAACAGQVPTVPDDAVFQRCGNGKVEGSEVCDDGNTDDGDECSADCSTGLSESRPCGNGKIDGNETCDDGNQIGGDGCSADCTSNERCGNGVLDTAVGETCDDGNAANGDGCSANCQSNEQCGNFNVDTGEQCDAGPNGSSTCDVNCTVASCGDGTVNAFRGEQCDAGPNGDASCDTNCTPAFCGDSTVNAARNESCDDGNSVDTDECIACASAACGDGFLRSGVEQCDDGNAVMTDACTTCKPAFCGDGFVRTNVEACDDANTLTNDACVLCRNAVCGDGFVRTGVEACDDGNNINTDACITGCTVARCGDGFVRAGVEQCDDGNNAAGDGCAANCTIEQQPKTYVLNNLACNTVKDQNGDFACSSTQLLGFTRDCGNRTNPYVCGQATGFTWLDATPFQPSRVRIEVSVGINASLGQPPMSISQTAVTSLNGTVTGNFLLPATSGQNQCIPTTTINTWELTNVSSYRRNQRNTLNIAAMNCFGVGFNAALNGFVRITVFP